MTTTLAQPTGFSRWWVYQKERFPLFGHGPLVLAFSISAVCFSALLRGSHSFPEPGVIFVAFATSLFSFLHLRIADEFKDFEEDSRYRPYRPVPRGLVSLRELAWLGAFTALLQIALALWLNPWLLGYLLVTWSYLALMSKEFFARAWLKARPITYMWTHMLIMPLIDFYATACDWTLHSSTPPSALFLFVIVSFFNGLVIEIGRKIRSEQEEETGVETYSKLWGRNRAPWVWFGCMLCTAITAGVSSFAIDAPQVVIPGLVILLLTALRICYRFANAPTPIHAKPFELFSGIWTLCMYLLLGAVPMLVRVASV